MTNNDISFKKLCQNIHKKPLLMGVLNVTPDSFSDGGEFFAPEQAVISVQNMVRDGADMIDMGGQSTRPDAVKISENDELNRLKPVFKTIRSEYKGIISVDTFYSSVAQYCLQNGADIINDVHGLSYDKNMARIISDYQAGCIIMHNKFDKNPECDIVSDVISRLSYHIDTALSAGIKSDKIMIDVGIGFGKTFHQNLVLLNKLSVIKQALPFKMLVGASRKSFIGHYLSDYLDNDKNSALQNPKNRVFGTLGVHYAAWQKGADVIRVHDVTAHYEMFKMLQIIEAADE